MFKIVDGRDYFYQWDLNRQIYVEDKNLEVVHFCNRTDECSLTVEVVNGVANVPNILLQDSFDIKIFAYDESTTWYEQVFKVKARTKPADYVYTETEVLCYEALEKRIDEIEKNGISEETITNAVNKYLEENPIDFTGYATEDYVNEAIENIDIPEVDLSKHALKSEIPTKVSQLQNDSKFITRDEVPQTDLSEYAKKSEIPDVSDFITSIPSEYITESELNAKGYATEKYVDDAIEAIDLSGVDLDNYYTKEETNELIEGLEVDGAEEVHIGTEQPTDPTIKVWINPEDTSGDFATKGYVDEAIQNLDIPDPDLSEYAKKTDIPDISGKADKNHTHVGYATNIYVQDLELNLYQELETNYALKTDIPDVSDFISEIPAEYITETELEAKGYLTEHQSLAGYATEKYVNDKIDELGEDLADYVDGAELRIAQSIPKNISQLYNDKGYITSIPSEYVTETELNAKGYLTEHQSLADYAKKSELFSKDYNDLTNKPTIPSIEGLATEEYVDNAIANIDIPETEVSAELVMTDDENGNVTISIVGGAGGGDYPNYEEVKF